MAWWFEIEVGIRQSFAEEAVQAFFACFDDYFTPHSAGAHVFDWVERKRKGRTIEGFQLEGAGGFENWRELGLSAQELVFGPRLRLPGEEIDPDNFCTYLEPGDCREAVLAWMRAYRAHSALWIGLVGNIRISLGAWPQPEERWIFRQLVPIPLDDPYLQAAPHEFVIRGRPCWEEELLRVRLFLQRENERLYVSFRTNADVWLEEGGAFVGRGRATARANTDELALRMAELVDRCAGSVAEVILAAKGRKWFAEWDRLWSTFQTVPGIKRG
jgi:hypothetical protein